MAAILAVAIVLPTKLCPVFLPLGTYRVLSDYNGQYLMELSNYVTEIGKYTYYLILIIAGKDKGKIHMHTHIYIHTHTLKFTHSGIHM